MGIPKVAIFGRPNVGKSTLFNRLIGERKAVTSSVPGTTRDRVIGRVSWGEHNFLLIDTAGFVLLQTGQNDIEQLAQEKVIQTLSEADLILFVIDAREGMTAEDRVAARVLRPFAEKVIVVANKLDDIKLEARKYCIDSCGFLRVVAVSSVTGRRCGQLLEEIVKLIPKFSTVSFNLPVMTIIGRPNVGKSTLFNRLIGKNISIVSDIPGTTRDSVEAVINSKGKSLIIFDTAGLRRRGKIASGIEKFSVLRALDSIIAADLCLVVIDGSEGITRQDASLVQMALSERKKVIVVINKIDKVKDESTENIANFYRFPFVLKNTIVGVSAKNNKNINLLVDEIYKRLVG